MLLGTAFLASMGIAFAWPAVSGVITEISVNRQRGGIAGVWTFFMDLAYFTGPIVGAVITGLKGNVSSVFLVFGLVLLLSAVPTVLMKDKKPVISGR